MIGKRANGKYYARVYDRAFKKQRWLGTFDTQREAKEAEAKALRSGSQLSDETCAGFAATWNEEFPRPKTSTNLLYARAAAVFAEEFGKTPLDDVGWRRARRWAEQQQPSVVNAVRAMFSDAQKYGLVRQNPFRNLGLPERRGRRDLTMITEAELDELAEGAKRIFGELYGSEFASLIRFTAYQALRAGEVCALRWQNIDEVEDVVHVKEAVDCRTDDQDNPVYIEPKTGPRTIALVAPAARALEGLRRDREFVFYSLRGEPLQKGSLHYAWNMVRSAFAPRPRMQFHELRHLGATFLRRRGVSPSVIGDHLGHKDGGRLVMELYGQLEDEESRCTVRESYAIDAISAADANHGQEGPAQPRQIDGEDPDGFVGAPV